MASATTPGAGSSGSRARRPRRSCSSSRRGAGSFVPRSRSCGRRPPSPTLPQHRQRQPPPRRRPRSPQSRISAARRPPTPRFCAGSGPARPGSTRLCWPQSPSRPGSNSPYASERTRAPNGPASSQPSSPASVGSSTRLAPRRPARTSGRRQPSWHASGSAAAAERLGRAAAEAAEAARSAAAAQTASGAGRAAGLDADLLRRVLGGAERLDETLAAAAETARRFESPLRARVDAGATRTGELGAALRDLGAAEVELRQGAEDAAQRATEIEIELTRIESEAADARRRLEEAGAEPAEGDDRDEVALRAERLEQRRIQLGQVNPLAKEEYEAEKERLAELEAQREDLEASLKELSDLRDELAETVERRFADTFAAVAEHFEEVAATLFPGGDGRLRLVEADEEGGEGGVEVELRPAGKKITRLGMLSGGEKALGAISFLFALFLAKPCPFYLLDEVEAALDDANIGRFVELLRRYADRAQFVVITHQKRTMEAADVLYGVTMGGDGVSQIVSRRLPREDAEALAS